MHIHVLAHVHVHVYLQHREREQFVHLVGRLKLSLDVFGGAFNGIQLLLQLLQSLHDITPQWVELRLTLATKHWFETSDKIEKSLNDTIKTVTRKYPLINTHQ